MWGDHRDRQCHREPRWHRRRRLGSRTARGRAALLAGDLDALAVITEFTTAMTGELYGLEMRHSILGRSG